MHQFFRDACMYTFFKLKLFQIKEEFKSISKNFLIIKKNSKHTITYYFIPSSFENNVSEEVSYNYNVCCNVNQYISISI